MDHIQLKEALESRLDKTDEKIDRNMLEVQALRAELHNDRIKTAVLENQMSGVIKVGFALLTAVIGIITFGIKKGMF